uniref:Putative secreted protein n=1 Tax=Anopheles darlingi TaxID=43151 RepID=A0A2M4D787_ANODA
MTLSFDGILRPAQGLLLLPSIISINVTISVAMRICTPRDDRHHVGVQQNEDTRTRHHEASAGTSGTFASLLLK